MLTIKKKCIINEKPDKVAVQLDIKTFEKIERLPEDYILANQIKANRKENNLEVNEAKFFIPALKRRHHVENPL